MVSVRTTRSVVLFSLLAAMGCKARNPDAAGLLSEETVAEGEPADALNAGNGELKLCAAVRGNGHYLLTHFGALSRITEHYGTIDALAGGSSSTVTMFMHESMKMNPLVKAAQGRDKDLRVALLLKSILGYVEVLKDSPEAQGIGLLVGVAQKAKAQGVFSLSPQEFQLAATKLQELLKDPKLVDLVNPTAMKMLQDTDNLGYLNYQYKVNEIKASAESITGFKAVDQKIFFREGIISFPGLARALGRMANFYAGYQPTDANLMADFLDSCATEEISAGKPWPAVAAATTPKGTCGTLFANVLKNYRDGVDQGKANPAQDRLKEPVGAETPSIISTAVLDGAPALKTYNDAKKRYLKNRDPKFNVDFKDVRFGYWIPERLDAAVDSGMKAGGAQDGKLEKFLNLGHDVTWFDVLIASPAEPGLSPPVKIAGDRLSIGGWSDLSPVQVLRSAGCDKVVYVTRRQVESTFLVSPGPIDANHSRLGVAEQLNMGEESRKKIYELNAQPGDRKSGFALAIEDATEKGGVWCTDWNVFGDAQPGEMFLHAYGIEGMPNAKNEPTAAAELISKDPDMTSGPRAYPKQAAGPIVGCTVP